MGHSKLQSPSQGDQRETIPDKIPLWNHRRGGGQHGAPQDLQLLQWEQESLRWTPCPLTLLHINQEAHSHRSSQESLGEYGASLWGSDRAETPTSHRTCACLETRQAPIWPRNAGDISTPCGPWPVSSAGCGNHVLTVLGQTTKCKAASTC